MNCWLVRRSLLFQPKKGKIRFFPLNPYPFPCLPDFAFWEKNKNPSFFPHHPQLFRGVFSWLENKCVRLILELLGCWVNCYSIRQDLDFLFVAPGGGVGSGKFDGLIVEPEVGVGVLFLVELVFISPHPSAILFFFISWI